jgi:FMN phosphatase YigB (HAD superfamily)
MHLFLDFDDTLVSGMNTWALVNVLPDLIREHGLPYDETHYREGLLAALESASQNLDESRILDDLFAILEWPDALKATLMSRVFGQFSPEIFEDTVSFLDRMKAAGHHLYIVSNNNQAEEIIVSLGLGNYFDAVFTPQKCGVERGKPTGEMWKVLARQLEPLEMNDACFVGDDPFSDGVFADVSGIPCYIIDRTGLYTTLYPDPSYRWVQSLAEIEP